MDLEFSGESYENYYEGINAEFPNFPIASDMLKEQLLAIKRQQSDSYRCALGRIQMNIEAYSKLGNSQITFEVAGEKEAKDSLVAFLKDNGYEAEVKTINGNDYLCINWENAKAVEPIDPDNPDKPDPDDPNKPDPDDPNRPDPDNPDNPGDSDGDTDGYRAAGRIVIY